MCKNTKKMYPLAKEKFPHTPYPIPFSLSISRNLNMLILSPFVFHLVKKTLSTLEKLFFLEPRKNMVIKPLIIKKTLQSWRKLKHRKVF